MEFDTKEELYMDDYQYLAGETREKPVILQIDKKNVESLRGQLDEQKLQALYTMKKRYFIEEELPFRLGKLDFTEEEIQMVKAIATDLEEEAFTQRYGMSPELYREWLEALEKYKDNPREFPFTYVHPPMLVLEEEEFFQIY